MYIVNILWRKKYKNFLLEFDADRKLVWNANNDRT